MTEPKFTKGEWVSTEGNTSGREVICPSATKSKRRIARIGGPDRGANSRLIAAAPDLYEALEGMIGQAIACFTEHYGENPEGGSLPEHIQRAQAALAKARGDSAKTIGGGE